jgi:hypothetical protein
MDVTVQFVVYVVVANILERCSTCGTLEAFHMQVLVLDAHKHTTADYTGRKSLKSLPIFWDSELTKMLASLICSPILNIFE